MAGSGRCPLSSCWDDFQADILAYFDNVDSSPDSYRCFESVLSHPDEPDLELDLGEQHKSHPLLDEVRLNDYPASLQNPYPRERLQLKANDHHPGVRFEGGPHIRRRRSDDDVKHRRRKLCATLRYFETLPVACLICCDTKLVSFKFFFFWGGGC